MALADLLLPAQVKGSLGAQYNFDELTRRWQDLKAVEARLTTVEAIEALHVVGATGEPAFQNAWVNFGSGEPVASFYKDRGRVYLAGSVKTGTVAAAMFTLPAGYRPPSDTVRFPVVDGSGGPVGTIIVLASGNVNLQVGNNAYVSLAPVHFRI